MKKSFFVGFLATLGATATTRDSYYSTATSTATLTPTQISAASSASSSTHTSTTDEVKTDGIKYPSVNVNALFPFSGTSYQSYNVVSSAAIGNAIGQTPITDRSIDSLFLKLPSIKELDRLILNADSVAILKTIQVVATNDSLTCDQRIAYLLEVLGRIRTAVQAKQLAADQLIAIIAGAKQEIVRLQGEIDRLNKSITNLWLPELYKKLADAVASLENLYKQFNALEFEIAPKEATLKGLNNEIKIVNDVSDAERNRINNDKLKLTEAQAQIRDLESRLAVARDQRAALQDSIKHSQSVIAANDKKISDARDKIDALESEIKKITSQVDDLRGKYTDLEVEVERLRTESSIARTKADQYAAQIAILQDRIVAEQKRLFPEELNNLNEMIKTLKRLIPSVQGEIDRHYYYCYGAGSVKPTENGGVVVYIVQGERFKDYLVEQYGSTIRAPAPGSDVRLQQVSIFDDKWVQSVGYPFNDASLGGNDGFDIAGSFNCLTPSRSVKNGGTIHEIGADYIGVKGYDGSSQRLSLASCSRIESTSSLPTIGQNIAYVAVPSAAQGFNLYQATCW